MEQSTIKQAGVAGVIWAAVTTGVALSIGSPPALDASADEVLGYVVDHRGAYLAASALLALTLPLFFVFVGTLAARVRTSGSSSASPMAIIGAASAGMVLTCIAYLLTLPLAFDSSLGGSASGDLVRLLYVGTFLFSMFANAALATAMLAVGLSGADSGLPAWLTRSATGLAAVILVGSAAGLVSADVALIAGAALFLITLWVIAAGVTMARTAPAVMAPVRTLAA